MTWLGGLLLTYLDPTSLSYGNRATNIFIAVYLKFLSPISSLSNQKFYPTEKAWYRLSSNSNVAHWIWMLFLFQMLLLPGTGPQVSCVQPHRTPLQDQAHLRGRGWGKLWGYVIYVLYIGYTIFSNQSWSTLQGVDNFWVLWWIISLDLINLSVSNCV